MFNNLLNIYSYFQSKSGFKKFDSKSIIKFPYKIWNKQNISIGSNVFIAENSFISAVNEWNGKKFTPSIQIGNNVTIGSNFFVTSINKIVIENDVLISDRVFISDHIHDYLDIKIPIHKQRLLHKGDVRIRRGSFIGINSVIMPGVSIGKNAVIGASSVVFHDVPDYSVAIGNPAIILKKYDPNTKKWERIR